MGKTSKQKEMPQGIITNLPDPDKLLVQKCRPLIELCSSDLTLSELKILDTYLGRIDSHDPEYRTVVFSKAELEDMLNVKKINNKQLKEKLRHLMQNIVEIPDPNNPDHFKLVTLFEEAELTNDEYGTPILRLECTAKAMLYFFNIDTLGYLRYKLRTTRCLTSRYSYVLFMHIESNRFRKHWTIPLDELKAFMGCDKEKTYEEYKHFNNLILKKAHNELNKKTECRFSYTPVKKGRTVTAIRFEVETLPKDILPVQVPGQIDFDEYSRSQKYLWLEAVPDLNLTDEEVQEIHSMLSCVPHDRLPDVMENVEINQFHYISNKYAQIKRIDAKNPIKNKVAYLRTIIEHDIN